MQATNPVVYVAHGSHLDGFNIIRPEKSLRYLFVFRFVNLIRYANRPTITAATLIAFVMGTQFQYNIAACLLRCHGRWRVITVDTVAKIPAF